ncbi:MAG: BACON domain-containing protein [Bacteroidales bacterium]|nr:BACON domain-containing protein [Bacteroidales bacterium]
MKNRFFIIAAALSVLSLASCERPDALSEEPAIKALSTELGIPAKGGDAQIALDEGQSYEVKTESSWLVINTPGTTSDRIIRMSAGANPTIQARYAQVVVTSGKQSKTFTVEQYGGRTSGFAPNNIVATADAATFEFPYDFDEMIEASVDAEWVSLEISETKLVVKLEENTTPATADSKDRKALVRWTLGVDNGIIEVSQRNVDFMKEDKNWKVEYLGLQKYEGEDAEFIQNTVTDPTISGKYGITFATKDAFTASNLPMADFVDVVVTPGLIADINDAVEYYSAFGYDVTFGDFLYEDTDYEIFNPFEAGDYYAIAVGLTEDGEATGHFAYSAFTKKGGSGPATGYDSWLGEWEVPHGNSTSKFDKWTITAKENGVSYSITGIEGYTDLAIEAMYDSSRKSLVVYAQEEIGTKTVGGEEAPVGFYSATAAGNFWTPGAQPYAVFEATMSGTDAATITPQVVNTSDGEVTPELALYIATTSDGYKLLKAFADATKMPNTMKRPGGSGGGEDPKYESWIGDWEILHGNSTSKKDTWTISAKEKGTSYSITGIEGYTDLAIEAEFDSSTGALVVYAQEEIGTKTLASGEDAPVGFYGATAAGNFWTPGAQPYTVFTATLSGSTATLTPATLNTESGEVTPDLGVYIATASDGYKLLKAFADATKLPNTLTKKGSGGGDNPGGDQNPDAVLGKWICPTVSDYWGENTYKNWTINIKSSGSGVEIEDFDIGFDTYVAEYDLKCDPAPATYDAASKTLTVAAGTDTGIASGGIPVQWIGLEGGSSIVDIEFTVDPANYTISLATDMFGAYINDDDPGFFSLYEAPVVFYKEGHTPASYSVMGSAPEHRAEFKMLSSSRKLPMFSTIYGKTMMSPRRAASAGVRMTPVQAESSCARPAGVKKIFKTK